ncbi:twin-arginine translocase TatA/TatE family subunit [Streptomyces sp. NPDC096132]|uniref:twin-arginine translocase TatA/TatE family subunit n=1 Tax=Streptomyces sp. NPDC096132 TaxID=3366075 RepID=UPI00382B822A
MFGLSELAVILVVVIAILCVKRLPDLARSAGKSARILKAEARAAKDEGEGTEAGHAPRIVQGETLTPGSAPHSGTERSAGEPSGTTVRAVRPDRLRST